MDSIWYFSRAFASFFKIERFSPSTLHGKEWPVQSSSFFPFLFCKRKSCRFGILLTISSFKASNWVLQVIQAATKWHAQSNLGREKAREMWSHVTVNHVILTKKVSVRKTIPIFQYFERKGWSFSWRCAWFCGPFWSVFALESCQFL